MQILTTAEEGVTISDAIRAHIEDKLSGVDRRFGGRITRVEVFLKDTNADKGGVDKLCTMESRPAGLEPVAASAQTEDVYLSIQEAARKLEKAIESRIGRIEGRKRRER